jgi:hypothetical protein
METVSARQRICFGKWVGKRRDRFLKQVKDHPMGGIAKWLRQSLDLIPGSIRDAKRPVTH